MRLITALSALALIASSVPAGSEDVPEWTYIGTTDSGTVIRAKTSDLLAGRSNQTAAKVWVRMDASKDASVQFREAMTLYAVNCVAETYHTIQVTTYWRFRSPQTEPGSSGTRFVIPGTHMETLKDMLCSDPGAQPDYR